MFSRAYEAAKDFTYPLIISTRLQNGKVKCGVGAFVIINPQGWIVTAAHAVKVIPVSQQHAAEIANLGQARRTIEQDPRKTDKKKHRELSRLRPNPEWITNSSIWWGRDGVRVAEFRVLEAADIAIGRLEPFDPASVPNYPVFKNPASLPPGTSLCKLGFPFHDASASFDEATNRFTLAPGTLPIPRFPIEGIYTRDFLAGHTQDGRDILFIETSSPGLRGQSGGPVFDVNGVVWGIQSHTRHFPLGFSPKATRGGREIEEHQFLNVGLAAHPATLAGFLNEHGVPFGVSAN